MYQSDECRSNNITEELLCSAQGVEGVKDDKKRKETEPSEPSPKRHALGSVTRLREATAAFQTAIDHIEEERKKVIDQLCEVKVPDLPVPTNFRVRDVTVHSDTKDFSVEIEYTHKGSTIYGAVYRNRGTGGIVSRHQFAKNGRTKQISWETFPYVECAYADVFAELVYKRSADNPRFVDDLSTIVQERNMALDAVNDIVIAQVDKTPV